LEPVTFFPFGNANLQCNGTFNEKTQQLLGGKRSFASLFCHFMFVFFPFTLSPILSLKKEGKPVSGEKAGEIFFSHFWLGNWKSSKGFTQKKST